MTGVAEWLWLRIWPVLPQRIRLSLTRFIAEAQRRARNTVPRSAVLVYPFSKENAERFKEVLAPDAGIWAQLPASAFPRYSLVSTCLNEASSIAEFLDSIARQTIPPSEVVICDGGSTDGTAEMLSSFKSDTFSVRVLRGADLSIAAGRNAAAFEAVEQILLFTDAGASLDRHWAERLLVPFAHKQETQVVMGWYLPIAPGPFEFAMQRYLVPQIRHLDPSIFLPSGRSLGVKTSTFAATGGYPEHLSFAGEDTLFDYYLKTVASHWAFSPDAISYWHMPKGVYRVWQTVFRYAKGDAESGLLFWDYYLLLLKRVAAALLELLLAIFLFVLATVTASSILLCVALAMLASVLVRVALLIRSYPGDNAHGYSARFYQVLAVLTLVTAQVSGFITGLKTRSHCEWRRHSSAKQGHLVLLLPEPLYYSPENQYCQHVLGLLENGWFLTVVSALGEEVLPYAHPHLETHLRMHFDVESWWHKAKQFHPEDRFFFSDTTNDALSRQLADKLTKLGVRHHDTQLT